MKCDAVDWEIFVMIFFFIDFHIFVNNEDCEIQCQIITNMDSEESLIPTRLVRLGKERQIGLITTVLEPQNLHNKCHINIDEAIAKNINTVDINGKFVVK